MNLERGFRLGSVTVRPLEGRIERDGEAVRVEPKAMEVLVELARHAPEVSARDDLVAAVWPRGYVTDDTLTRCIGQLRRALGDTPKSPELIETIPRRGYRLTIEAEPLEPPLPAGNDADGLLVLPFQSLGPGAEDFVADGLTELLIARLAAARPLRVISRTTAMCFRGATEPVGVIAQRCGARWIVEGSVLQAGDRMQVVAQLIDARRDAHVWAGDFLRNLTDLLVLQNEIASQIASAIRLELGVTAPRRMDAVQLSPDDMRRYLYGRHLLAKRTTEALLDAVETFEAVSAAQPDFAPAWASAAEARYMLTNYGVLEPSAAAIACRADLERALAQDPSLGIALACRGATRFAFDGDLAAARQDLLSALERLPNYSLAMLALANVEAVDGHAREAMNWLDQALLVDPMDVGIRMNLGDHHILQRRYDEAVVALDAALALAPNHRPSRLRRAWAMALAGEGRAAADALDAIGPNAADDVTWLEYAALVHAAIRDSKKARDAWTTLKNKAKTVSTPAWGLARAAAAAGDTEAALDALREAVTHLSPSVRFARLTPALDGVRDDPRFERLLSAQTA